MVAGGGPRDAERHGLARQTAEGTRAAGRARHGDREGVRADRQGRELGGYLPGAEPGPLGRVVSPALSAQATPVERLRRPRPRLGLAGPATPPPACVSPRFVPSPSPSLQPDPNMAQPPFVPTGPHPCCFLVWTGPPQALFLCLPGRGWARRHPPPGHISFPRASVCGRAGGPRTTSPLLLPVHSFVGRELESLFGHRHWRWCVLNATVDLPYP